MLITVFPVIQKIKLINNILCYVGQTHLGYLYMMFIYAYLGRVAAFSKDRQ
jgi:hypothetical protein